MITDQVPGTKQVIQEQRTAVHGALWVTVGMVAAGLSNYGYSLLLIHLLNVTEYSVFSAGQGLILWATNIAIVSVPWVLAQSVARAKSERERNSAIRFSRLMSFGDWPHRRVRGRWHSHSTLRAGDSCCCRSEHLRHLPRDNN